MKGDRCISIPAASGFISEGISMEVDAFDAPPLRVQVSSNFESVKHLQLEWDTATRELQAPIYMTYDWLKTWWEFYGKNCQLRLFIFWAGEKIVGILPAYLESFGFAFWKTKVARLVGANIPPKTFNPPVEPELAFDVFSKFLRHLFVADGCDLLSLGPVSKQWSVEPAWQSACAASPDIISSATYHQRDVQTVFRLPPSFEDYLGGLSGSERKSRLKRVRHLEKDHKVTVDTVTDPLFSVQEFESFARQHATQWRAIGKGGHFEAWPRAEEFNRLLVARQSDHGRVRFFRMLVDGQVVVSRYTFLLGSTVYSELPAREIGEPWDKLGIGGISLLKFNQQLIEAGIECVDSGLGGYEHKTQLGGEEVPVGVWRVTRTGLVSRVKSGVFLLYGAVVRGLLQKIWYRRILPKLPLRFGRSQALYDLRYDA